MLLSSPQSSSRPNNKSGKLPQKSTFNLEKFVVIVIPSLSLIFLVLVFCSLHGLNAMSSNTRGALEHIENTGISVSKMMLKRMTPSGLLRGGNSQNPFPCSINGKNTFETIPHPVKQNMTLKVPKFWDVLSSNRLNLASVLDSGGALTKQQASLFGSIARGLTGSDAKTIYVGLVNYQNSNCRRLVNDMIERAKFPDRLRFGIVDQIRQDSESCDPNKIAACSTAEGEKSTPPISCKYKDHIDAFIIEPDLEMGTVFTRHFIARMYRGEHFALSMDAHTTIVKDWDVELIGQWESIQNEMAIITTRPLKQQQPTVVMTGERHRALSSTNGGGFGDNGGNTAFNTDPRMELCEADFVGDSQQTGSSTKMLTLVDEQPEGAPSIHKMPQLQPYWTPDFSFSRGHFLLKVKPDPYLPMVFMGEDVSVSIRAFTHGYDFYAPIRPVAFYDSQDETANDPSSRRGRYYLDKLEKEKATGKASQARLYGIVKLIPQTRTDAWSHTEEIRYGLGTSRDTSKFFATFGIHAQERVIEKHLCTFVSSGAMHKMFHQHLRPDLGSFLNNAPQALYPF